ncbi:MAG: HAD family hydrolase [Oscillospiraceae bacterium]|nr:HAD family hydrolase [Oscillospiraceae bacterium]
MKKYILFDLDGTLTESDEGIVNSIQYALGNMGMQENDRSKLMHFIGPPLLDSFRNTFFMSKEKAELAVKLYRQYYAKKGIFECKLYDGVPKMLEVLHKTGRTLGVVTSKPQVYTEQILEHFDIAKYFSAVVGSELDGTRTDKVELIAEAMRQLGATPQETLMVGDRKFDVIGAEKNGVKSIGVMYGYGSMTELMDAGGGADYIVSSPRGLTDKLLGIAPNTETYFNNMLLQ